MIRREKVPLIASSVEGLEGLIRLIEVTFLRVLRQWANENAPVRL